MISFSFDLRNTCCAENSLETHALDPTLTIEFTDVSPRARCWMGMTTQDFVYILFWIY